MSCLLRFLLIPHGFSELLSVFLPPPTLHTHAQGAFFFFWYSKKQAAERLRIEQQQKIEMYEIPPGETGAGDLPAPTVEVAQGTRFQTYGLGEAGPLKPAPSNVYMGLPPPVPSTNIYLAGGDTTASIDNYAVVDTSNVYLGGVGASNVYMGGSGLPPPSNVYMGGSADVSASNVGQALPSNVYMGPGVGTTNEYYYGAGAGASTTYQNPDPSTDDPTRQQNYILSPPAEYAGAVGTYMPLGNIQIASMTGATGLGPAGPAPPAEIEPDMNVDQHPGQDPKAII